MVNFCHPIHFLVLIGVNKSIFEAKAALANKTKAIGGSSYQLLSNGSDNVFSTCDATPSDGRLPPTNHNVVTLQL